MLGLLRPIIPFGTPSIFWTKTLYHLPLAIDERPAEELLATINRAMQSLGGTDRLEHDVVSPFTSEHLELGETRLFKTNLLLDPSKLAIAPEHDSLPLSLIAQISISLDFAQWTFIIDLGKDEAAKRRHTRFGPIDNRPIDTPDWRTDFLKRVHEVSALHERALSGAPLNDEETVACSNDTELLMNVCFVQIWEQFRAAYSLVNKILSGEGPHDKLQVIHEAQGLALSTRGLSTDDNNRIVSLTDEQAKTASRTTLGTPARYLGQGGEKVGEPNEAHATLSAFWQPMVKTMTPDINNRQYVACGVLGFKALLISALGSPTQTSTPSPRDHDPSNRVLFITKAEPSTTQLARIVDRLVALEVYAAYSLWHDKTLLRADRGIMRLGNNLDEHIGHWTANQANILDAAERRREDATRNAKRSWWRGSHFRRFEEEHRTGRWIDGEPSFMSPRRKSAYRRFVDIELYRIDDVRDAQMASASEEMNNRLTTLARDINRVGRADGTTPSNIPYNVPFMVARSRLYSEYFNSVLPTFQAGNIDTWLSYDSFGRRGRMPRQNAIDRTGVRIENLNRRLQAITELIQTSALIWQTTATRSNTAKIRRVIVGAVVALSILYAAIRYSEYMAIRSWDVMPKWLWDTLLELMSTLPAG